MKDKPELLLVDDEPDLLLSLVGLLRREFKVHTAESGEQALGILAAHPIAVLMTDQRMPGMTGSELLQKVCQQKHSPTLILFTGYADIKSVIEAVNTGRLFRYVTKPWDPEHLLELLHHATGEYTQRSVERQLQEQLEQCQTVSSQVAETLRTSLRDGVIDRKIADMITRECDRLETLVSLTQASGSEN